MTFSGILRNGDTRCKSSRQLWLWRASNIIPATQRATLGGCCTWRPRIKINLCLESCILSWQPCYGEFRGPNDLCHVLGPLVAARKRLPYGFACFGFHGGDGARYCPAIHRPLLESGSQSQHHGRVSQYASKPLGLHNDHNLLKDGNVRGISSAITSSMPISSMPIRSNRVDSPPTSYQFMRVGVSSSPFIIDMTLRRSVADSSPSFCSFALPAAPSPTEVPPLPAAVHLPRTVLPHAPPPANHVRKFPQLCSMEWVRKALARCWVLVLCISRL